MIPDVYVKIVVVAIVVYVTLSVIYLAFAFFRDIRSEKRQEKMLSYYGANKVISDYKKLVISTVEDLYAKDKEFLTALRERLLLEEKCLILKLESTIQDETKAVQEKTRVNL